MYNQKNKPIIKFNNINDLEKIKIAIDKVNKSIQSDNINSKTIKGLINYIDLIVEQYLNIIECCDEYLKKDKKYNVAIRNLIFEINTYRNLLKLKYLK